MAEACKYVIIDTCILEKASGLLEGSPEDTTPVEAWELLHRIVRRCHKIILDEGESQILEEYGPHIRGYVQKFFWGVCDKRDKIVYKPMTRNGLRCRDPDDQKFIDVATTINGTIVTLDPDLLELRESEELSRKGVRILSLGDALQQL